MKKKLLAVLGCVALLCCATGLGACSSSSVITEKQKEGYVISVTYDSNGGLFMNRSGITVVDLFNPSDYEPDANGMIHIALREPTDESRPISGSDPISLTKKQSFFAGWYQTRTVKTENGLPVDEDGNVLTAQDDGTYADQSGNVVTPAYEYSDYWNFETDTLDYNVNDESLSLTLYAGWVSYYEFDYYYQTDDETWKLYATTSFDYKTTHKDGSLTWDKDTIWIPDWQNGVMTHTHTYDNKTEYTFPGMDGMTFNSAYLDEACTQKIKDSFTHKGTLKLETAEAEGRVQNIYVKFDRGTYYKISEAQQLCDNPNTDGIYEIVNDLDFTDCTWPILFSSNTFRGRMYGADGKQYKLSNISVTNNGSASLCGGVFGKIAETASIENLYFENATYDLQAPALTNKTREACFGLFAGYIEEGASVFNVKADGTLRLGYIATLGDAYSLHLCANGSLTGIDWNGSVVLIVYGQDLGYYFYTIDPHSVEISADGAINLIFERSNEDDNYNESYTINGGEKI